MPGSLFLFHSIPTRFDVRPSGFGKEIYQKIKDSLPFVFDNLSYYKDVTFQTKDSYAVFREDKTAFGIQLDPICEVIVLWNDHTQVEIGTWSKDEYAEAIEFILNHLLSK